ncbi:DUF2971 domain-containing protein [Paucibacter sp. DJ1R-11]|uniref:DUF2971 domain-containing protein n=1 Tax=Paucibacter sp. DJ1R-11 TaxID=2893556 RepID=UPI00398C6F54
MFFGRASAFNDPFDCYPSFDLTATDTELIDYCKRVLQRSQPGLPERQAIADALAWVRDGSIGPRSPGFLERTQAAHTAAITEIVGVLCVASDCSNPLLWSHYADQHQGVCLRFDAKHEYFSNAHPVNYCAERPKVNPFRHSNEEMLDAALFSKSAHWGYEGEWRMLKYRDGPGEYQFPPEALTGVILGARATPATASMVAEWVRARGAPVTVQRARLSRDTYDITVE